MSLPGLKHTVTSHLVQSQSKCFERPSAIPHPCTHSSVTSSSTLPCANPVLDSHWPTCWSLNLPGMVVPPAFALALVHAKNVFTSDTLCLCPTSFRSLNVTFSVRTSLTIYFILFLPSTFHHQTQHTHTHTNTHYYCYFSCLLLVFSSRIYSAQRQSFCHFSSL